MISLMYNILFSLFLVVSFPYFLLRGLFARSFRTVLAQRFGRFPPLPSGRPIWIHAASVGEVLCSMPLVKKIRSEFPGWSILLTTMTQAGNETARRQLPEVDEVLFFPWDHPFVLGRAFRKIDPALLLIAETELWPNLLRFCGRKGVEAILFNGRISDPSFPRYRLLRFFFKRYLQDVPLFLMQTERDRHRIVQIGASPERTRVAGNIKFDQTVPPLSDETKGRWEQSFGLRGDEKILIAGSTHSGEEEILLGVHHGLLRIIPDLILILCPRHLDRLDQVEKVLRRKKVAWVRRSALSPEKPLTGYETREQPRVVLLDTLGELMKLYSLGTLVFIGGSLVPVGGHNPLEPLFFKKGVLFGPHMFNFREISRMLVESGGALQVRDAEDLLFHSRRLLQEERARQEMGERGHQVLQTHRGATERIFREILPFLKKMEGCRSRT
jgi:3-deoxy-D-manno-octulosonic-acid transferase